MENLKNIILHSFFYNVNQIYSHRNKPGLVFLFPSEYEGKEFVNRIQIVEKINFQFEIHENDKSIVGVWYWYFLKLKTTI